MLTIYDVPLSVLNRALELYKKPPQENINDAMAMLIELLDEEKVVFKWTTNIAPFERALVEYMYSGEEYDISFSLDEFTDA